MQYGEFIDSLKRDACPGEFGPALQALWYDATGQWDRAHEIVQRLDDVLAARIHAYLHRKEGDEWNARYWHRRAGTAFPAGLSLASERDALLRELLE
jgi:hypothetical protein